MFILVDLSELLQSYNFNQHFLFNKSSFFFEPIHIKNPHIQHAGIVVEGMEKRTDIVGVIVWERSVNYLVQNSFSTKNSF